MSDEEPTTDGGTTGDQAPDSEADDSDGTPAADPETVEEQIEAAAADLEGVYDPLAGDSDAGSGADEGVDEGAESRGTASAAGPDDSTPTAHGGTSSIVEADDEAVEDSGTDPAEGSAESDAAASEAGESGEAAPAGADDEGRGGGEDLVTVEAEISPVQREVWQRQADNAKLTLSEYIRRMVEAGRMSVQMELAEQMEAAEQQQVSSASTDEEELREQIEFLLDREGVLSWEELVEKLSRNFEESVGKVLEALQDEGKVRHSGFRGGYVLKDDGDDG